MKTYKMNSYSSFGQYTYTSTGSNFANICGKVLSLASKLTETPDSYLGVSDASYEVDDLREAAQNGENYDRLLLYREGGTSSVDVQDGLIKLESSVSYLQFWRLQLIQGESERDMFCKLERVSLSESLGISNSRQIFIVEDAVDQDADRVEIPNMGAALSDKLNGILETYDVHPVYLEKAFGVLQEKRVATDQLLVIKDGHAFQYPIENNMVALVPDQMTDVQEYWRLTIGEDAFPSGNLRRVRLTTWEPC